MSEPTDDVLDVRMRGENETVRPDDEPQFRIRDREALERVAAGEDEMPETTPNVARVNVELDAPSEILPLLVESARIERARARMWHALSLLVFLIVAASVVPLIIASAKVAGWLAGL